MLIRRLATGILATALCFGAAAQQGGQLVTNHERALQLQAEKNWVELLNHLDEWQAEGGQDPIIYNMRTRALRETGDIAGAIATMRELQRDTPPSQTARYAEILRSLGELHEERGDLESAELSYRRSLSISEVALTWRRLAQLLVQKDPLDEKAADGAWRKTLSYGQYINDAGLWKDYAAFRSMLDDQVKTYRALEHVVRLSPGDVPAWHRLFMLADQMDKEKVLPIIASRLARIDAGDTLANVYLGRQAQKRGDKRIANYHYNIAVRDTKDAALATWQAEAFFGLAQNAKNRGETVKYYRSALLADPTLFTAWENAIVTLRRMRRLPEARIYSEKFFQVRQYLGEGRELPEDILVGI